MQPQSGVLRTRHLPKAAFALSSTTVNSSPSVNPTNPKRNGLARGATFPTLPTPSQNMPLPAFNPFFDAVRQNLELSQGITERIPLRLSRRVRHRIHDLPFPWLREIARRAAKLAPRNRNAIDASSSTSEESEDDENITSADVEEGKEALAMQFFKIEVAEQRRLMGIMEHHTKETTIVTSDMGATRSSSSFPYSITAGVEKGAKNRYRHIWPFEHARVRLHQRREADDDYVNASYVQPLGTNKRYIATQGPLPATFTDFWTLCWEQNVHVIVMLTREVENSMVKCGSYWTDSEYGPLRLRLISTTGASPLPEEPSLFPARPAPLRHLTTPSRLHQQYPKSRHHTRNNEIIRRVFELTNTNYPDAPSRKIVHLQYLEWPDLNVPDDPRGILELIKVVDDATKETQGSEDTASTNPGSTSSDNSSSISSTEVDERTGIAKQALSGKSPVLLHCSAGVGRTGGFIAVDTVLDAIRRQLRKQGSREGSVGDENAMDVDLPPQTSPAPNIVSSVAPKNDATMPDQGGETISITINAGNGHKASKRTPGYVVHVPVVPNSSSDGTDPEVSGSESLFSDQMPSSANISTNTRAWAENVSLDDGILAGSNQPKSPPRISDSEIQLLPPSQISQSNIPSDSSSSSNASLLDLSGANGHSNANGTTNNYAFPLSSSFATSIAAISSPDPSPPRVEAPSVPSMFLSVDRVRTRPASEPSHPPKTVVDGSQFESPYETVPHPPMARTTSGDSSASPRRRAVKPSFTLRAPPYTGGLSSDAEPPSRSVSPSADEGSVASQVSSYHSYLKQHHYQPIHHQSLPVSLDRPDKRKNIRNLHLPAPAERLVSPDNSQSAPTGKSSDSATAVDFKRPRPLHGTGSPPALTSFDDPVYEIVQDMREQRMSLCQSLRQYVFVHAAILEGALMIVDEERELMKEKERDRTVEMAGIRMEPERQENPENSRMMPVEWSTSGSSDASGSNASVGVFRSEEASETSNASVSRLESRPFLGQPGVTSMSMSTAQPSSSAVVPTTVVRDEGEGYFSSFATQPPITFGLTNAEGVEENPFESVFSPRPRLPAGVLPSTISRSRHVALDVHLAGKRSTSPSDYFRDRGGLDDDPGLFKRPSVKRKQPSGEGGDNVTRKRATNQSSSRERERRMERRMSSGSHSHPRDGAVDVLTSGLVR
ncbi:hypothetical protein NP233_g540 [Leucocoprinus birnbaumii]|uniref:Uncharacterized protein n=1 Tax=Leucocoprinus birnbaumii TaxID=56174 RepID=A0AAD5W1N8_9AGAR|nr:hypothetical protein NP233_g540 [Leucocoprinus birnbaumii]